MRVIFLALFSCLLSLPVYAANVDQAQALHLLNRITYGPSPYSMTELQKMGLQAYIEQQLHPETIASLSGLDNALSSLQTTRMQLTQLTEQYLPEEKNFTPDQKKENRKRAEIIVNEMSQAKILRAVYSPAQLQELMVDFWFNHFNVFAGKEADRVLISTYERDAIRPYVMGNFQTLLIATAKHPAMLYYLDNWLNTAPNSRLAKGKFTGINENYAREIMELHTMGVNGGYTQQDVTVLAHILTGWGLDTGEKARDRAEKISEFNFDPRRHDYSQKTLLNQLFQGSGEGEVQQAVYLLAHHPSTARHISYELAQYFVADEPPESLVNAMTITFQNTDGDIRSVLSTMLYSKEFWDPKYYQTKFKSPLRYVISAERISGGQSTADALDKNIKNLGEPLYGCLTPDGYPNTNDRWLNSDAILKRIDFARKVVNGKLEKDDNVKPLDPIASSQSMLACLAISLLKAALSLMKQSPNLNLCLYYPAQNFLCIRSRICL